MDADEKICLNIGRRTGKNILAGKKIRKNAHGIDLFEDYWTDSDNTFNSTKSNVLQATLSYSPSSAKSKSVREKGDAPFTFKQPQIKKCLLLHQSSENTLDDSKKSNNEVRVEAVTHFKAGKASSHFDELDLDIMKMMNDDDNRELSNHEMVNSRHEDFNCDSTREQCTSSGTSPFKQASDRVNKQKQASLVKSLAKTKKIRPINAGPMNESSTEEDDFDDDVKKNLLKYSHVPNKKKSTTKRNIKSTYCEDLDGVSKHNHDVLNEIDAASNFKVSAFKSSSSKRKFHESHGAPPCPSKKNQPVHSERYLTSRQALDSIIDDKSFWRGSETEDTDSDSKENSHRASCASSTGNCDSEDKKKSKTLHFFNKNAPNNTKIIKSGYKNKKLVDSLKQNADLLPERNEDVISKSDHIKRKTLSSSVKAFKKGDTYIATENNEKYFVEGDSDFAVRENPHFSKKNSTASSNDNEVSSEPHEIMIQDNSLSKNSTLPEPNENIKEKYVSKPDITVRRKTRLSVAKPVKRDKEIVNGKNGRFLEDGYSNSVNSNKVKSSSLDKNLPNSSKPNAEMSSEPSESIIRKNKSKHDIAARKKARPSLRSSTKSPFKEDNASVNYESSSEEKDHDSAVEKKLRKSRVSSKNTFNVSHSMKSRSGKKKLTDPSKCNVEMSSKPNESIIQEREISKPDIVARRKAQLSPGSYKSPSKEDNPSINYESSSQEKDCDSAIEKKLQKSHASSKNTFNVSRNMKSKSGNKNLANSSKRNVEMSSEPNESITQEKEISKPDIVARKKAQPSLGSSNKSSFEGENASVNCESSSEEKDYDSAVEENSQKLDASSEATFNISHNMKPGSSNKKLANSSMCNSEMTSEAKESIIQGEEISKPDVVTRRKAQSSFDVEKNLQKSHASSKDTFNVNRKRKSSSGNKNLANSSKHNAEVFSETNLSMIQEKEIPKPDSVARRKEQPTLRSSNKSFREDNESYSKGNNSAVKEKSNHESCETTAESINRSILENEPDAELDTSVSRKKRQLDQSHCVTNKSNTPDSLPLIKAKKIKTNQRKVSKKVPELEENISKYGRRRFPPLARWRNERLVFHMEEGELTMLGIDKGTGEDDGPLQSIYKALNKPKIKLKKPKKAILTIPGQKKLKSADLLKRFNLATWEQPNQEDSQNSGYHIKTMFEPPETHFGYLQIEVGQEKPPQYLPLDDLHLTVMRGMVDVTIQKNSYTLYEKDQLKIPRNCVYSIKNVSKMKALLSFARGIF